MRRSDRADVVIVGGGASGLAAAIELGMLAPGLDIVILEKNHETGRKIRATGSGRCNISNTEAEGYSEIAEFFTRIGLVTRTYASGLVYPYSESAADAADMLSARAAELGARIITDAEVTDISRCENVSDSSDNRYEVTYTQSAQGGRARRVVYSRNVILACGGKAGPMYGTTGDGYRLASGLGHTIVTPVPVLTQVECEEWSRDHIPQAISLAGTRSRGTVTLLRRDADSGELTEIFRETGEVQFTRTGLSGICVFNMTRHMRYNRSAGERLGQFTVMIDLFPDGDITGYLRDRRGNAFPGERVNDVLRTVLKENIASYVISAALAEADDIITSEMTDDDIERIASSVHSLRFTPQSLKGWKEAQATSGGVSLDEIDPVTSESKLSPGLYITGELADRDFMCGGFNLSNAWLTGIQAARDIAPGE